MRLSYFVGLFLMIVSLSITLVGCELVGSSSSFSYDEIQEIRYTPHVQSLLNQKCAACHAGSNAAGGLRLDSWDHILEGSDAGEAVIAFDADNSLMIEMVTKLRGGPHPREQGADTLRQDEVNFLTRWIEEGAFNDDNEIPFEDAAELLYVCNQEAATIYVIDTETNVVIRTVDLQDYGFSSRAKPHDAAVEPDGSHWYVSLIGENKVLKFTRDNELVGEATFETPGMVVVHPTIDRLYVGRSLSAVNPPSSIGMITRSTMQIEEVGTVFARPHALAARPDYIFTASLTDDQLIALDALSLDASFTFINDGPHTIVQHALSPDGRTMYSSAQVSNEMIVFDVSDGEDIKQLTTIPVNEAPWHPTYTPDGRYVYVGNQGSNTVTMLDANRAEILDIIRGNGLAEPHGSAATRNGNYIYISNRNSKQAYRPRYDLGDNTLVGTVVVIDATTNDIVKVLEVDDFATGLGIRPF